MWAARILQSYAAVMAIGLLLGLAVGGLPAFTREVSMAALAVVMTLSLTSVRLSETRTREHFLHSAKAMALNYALLTGAILVIGTFFEGEFRWGWVLMAAAPSAVSVVPFTRILGGETSKALFSTAVNYLSALLLMPMLTVALIGSAVSVEELIYTLLILIALPMAASRAVARLPISKEANTMAMNFSFAVMIFAVTGANRDAFFGAPGLLAAISLGCFLRTFGTGLCTEFALRTLAVPKADRVPYVLFASYKNLGLSATLALALFEPAAAVPATVCIVFEVVWMIFLVRYYAAVPR